MEDGHDPPKYARKWEASSYLRVYIARIQCLQYPEGLGVEPDQIWL